MVSPRHLLCALGFALCQAVFAGSVPNEQASLLDDYAVYRWQVEEGLPEDSVLALLFASDGYLWCLTDQTLARFDGMRFDRIARPQPQIPGTQWSDLSETAGGSIWLHGSAGAYGFHSRTPAPLTGNGSLVPAKGEVHRVLQEGAVLWAVVSNGIYRLENRHSRLFPLPKRVALPKVAVNAAEMAPDGQIWMAAGPAILRFVQGSYVAEDVPTKEDVLCLSIGRDAVVWAATATNLLCRAGKTWKVIPAPPHRIHPRWRITALRAFDTGELWVGTTSGLWRLKQGVWSGLSPQDGFYPLEIRCIARDTEGNIWAGSSGGLLRLRRKAVQVYDSGLILHRHSFTAVLPDPEVGLWVGVAGGGLLSGAPGAFRPYEQTPVSRTAVISALLKAKDGSLWIGTQGDYLWRCHDGRADCITEPVQEEDAAVNVNALLEDRKGRIWVGTGRGVMVYSGEKGLLEPVPGIPAEARVHALLEDREGAIWIGFQGAGLACLASSGKVSVFCREHGLPANTVMALCQDADGVIWAGTTEGLGRWDGYKWTSITERQGLPEGPLSQLLEDGSNLWVGTRYGITRLSRAELAGIAPEQTTLLSPQSFGRNEGLREEQCASGFGNLAARDEQGRLWFSTFDGLALIDPKRVAEKYSGGLRVYIEEVRSGQKVISSFQDKLSHSPFAFPVSSRGGRISIRYSAPFFSAPDQVQFKRVLEGFDLVWSAPTQARTIEYSRLPPGRYRFRVMAGIGGSWRESMQTVDFVVKPALWQRPWFWILTGGLALALVGLWVRASEKRRSRRRFLKLEREQALERERSRIAHDLHDDLGAALTEVGLLSAVAGRPAVSPERARHYLGEITEKIRVMVDTLDEIVWAINPRNDTVNSLGDYFCECAQRLLKLTSIRCRLDLSPNMPAHPLDPDRRHNLFLAFNEALNNVIRHSGATEAAVGIVVENGRLIVSIADDGSGLKEGPASSGAEGLNSMRRRLERMGGKCEINGRGGQGTTVRFIVPL